MSSPFLHRALRYFAFAFVAFALLGTGRAFAAKAVPGKPDVIVAADGTGRYKTIREAIDASPQITSDTGRRWTILVKPGIYRELLYVQREKRFTALVGENAEKTILTYDLSERLPGPDDKIIGTFRTSTLVIDADDFLVENMTIENSAGARGPALALRVDGDRVVFRGCRFLGWQDTILVNRGRHYFEDCHIEGAVDFIFGGATAYFERCLIRVIGVGFITAASTPDHQPFGFVFANSKIVGVNSEVKTFLGRPWRDYAKTVFLNCEMSEVVHPAGWDNWKKPQAEKAAFYAEYKSTGAGATPLERAPWSKQLTAEETSALTREKVLAGADGWDPVRLRKGR
jgi:pectinesterase